MVWMRGKLRSVPWPATTPARVKKPKGPPLRDGLSAVFRVFLPEVRVLAPQAGNRKRMNIHTPHETVPALGTKWGVVPVESCTYPRAKALARSWHETRVRAK